jgi:hypothetical protein
MKKLWWIVPLLAACALAAYVVAGPYLAIRGISQAIEQQDTAALERHVDFPLQIAGGLTGAGVDTLVTPLGIGALLQGHQLWKRSSGQTVDGDTWSAPMPARPLHEARKRFESTSRFTATVRTDAGDPVVFVLDRQGLRWRLTDIRLPLATSTPN